MNQNNTLLANLLSVLKVTIAVIVVTTGLVFLSAFLLYQFRFSNTTLQFFVAAIYLISNFIGGLIIGKAKRERKFIWGLSTGITYFFILLILSLIFTHGLPEMQSAGIALLSCLLGGILGGMLA